MKKLCIILFALAFAFNVYAADIKISELPVVTSVTPATDIVPVVASGATSQVTVTNLMKGANAGTATALAANPTDCGANAVATAIDASGNLTCGYSIGTNIQAYNADLATLAVGGSANCLWGEKSDSSGIECKSTISVVIDDSAAQFKDASAPTSLVKIDPTAGGAGYTATMTFPNTADATYTFPTATATLATLGANTFTAKQTFDATTGIQVGATGVLITSDDDGAITFLGASGGYDEDLTINLDDTENTAVVSSSTGVTKLSSAAIAWSGPVIAPEVLIDCAGSADPYAYCTSANASTLTAPQVNRTIINSYGRAEAQTVTLPTAAAGMTFIVIVGTQHNSKFEIAKGGSDLYLEVSGAPHGVAAFSETNQAVGSRASCATFKTGSSAWSWICGGISGTWDHTDL